MAEELTNVSFNIHGNINSGNLDTRYEETQKYGPIRLEMAKTVSQAMNECGWVWSLDGGNLLAAVRDGGKMLPHDDDFDFWLFSEEVSFE